MKGIIALILSLAIFGAIAWSMESAQVDVMAQKLERTTTGVSK